MTFRRQPGNQNFLLYRKLPPTRDACSNVSESTLQPLARSMTDSTVIRLPPGLFITATGTGAGKTFVTRGLAAALQVAGHSVAALKPIETGMPGDAQLESALASTDAALLAQAAGRPGFGQADGFYRAAMPAAPRAVSLATGSAAPDLEQLTAAIRAAAHGATALLVEGAGGLLVPLDRERTIADLALQLELPILLVAPNALGVLSHTLTACESAERRRLPLAAIVLTELAPLSDASDPSRPHNAAILRERVPCPVLTFPFCADGKDATLAAAAASAQLPTLLPPAPRV
jgi:dethiobiotin synthetase